MSIFGSEEESLLDTLLLYLYQTVILVSLAAAGFIFYLFRTRAPLKEKDGTEGEGETGTHENGQLVDGAASVSDDEILLRSALLHEGTGHEPDGYPSALAQTPPPPPPAPPQPAPRSKPRPEEEEEEEEEEGPAVAAWQPAIRQMVTTRQGVQEGPVPTHQPTFVQNSGVIQFSNEGYHDQHQGFYAPQPPPQSYPQPSQFVNQPGYSDAIKFEAKKRIGSAIQKKQVQEWVGGGEFDEAITNIRAASQRLQTNEY